MTRTIVVPTDFSEVSVNAANYAAVLARYIKASITLLHVWNLPAIGQDLMSAETIKLLIDDAEKNIEALKEQLLCKTNNGIEIFTEIREGNTLTQVKQYCDLVTAVMVVMGAHDTTAGERIVFGSNALDAMHILRCPLLILPVDGRFTGITNVGLACDLQDTNLSNSIETLSSLFAKFYPILHILHVTTKKHGFLSEKQISMADSLKRILKDHSPVFHFMQGEKIETSLARFSEENNLDLLIVIPKKHDLLSRLLTKSHSKQIMLNARVPVMSVIC